MPELDEQGTPEVVDVDEAVQQDPVVGDQTDPTPAKDEPFLPVNERTVYKTREDAIRGYNEAASRIAQLSGWEKQAKAYGLSDPKQLDAVAKELLELRKEKADAAAKLQAAPKTDPADPKAKESQQVKEYLKNLGYVSKEDQASALKELQDRLDRFEQSGKQSEELRFQNQEAEARNDVGGYLTAAGVKDDANGTKLQVVGTLVKDWINNDEERIERWTRGGVTAKNLVKEGFDQMLNALGWKPAVTPAAGQLKPTDPGYAAAKAKAVATNKKLPAQGTGRSHGDGSKPKVLKGHINTALHNKAWEYIQDLDK
jgi:hypothetical protein